MIFNTYWFFVFAAIFFPLYWALWRPGLRLAALLVACVLFHTHFAGPAGVIPIVVIGILTYFAALSRRSWLCAAGIVLCVAALCFYKYALFLSQNLLGTLNPAWGEAAATQAQRFLPLAPPLAISFFAFEFVHYLVEIRRGGEPIRRPADFMLFALHFPSLVAGPIKRYQDYVPSLHEGLQHVSPEDVAAGIQRMALGVVKKVILADNIMLMMNFYEERFPSLPSAQAWLFLGGLAARILLDFSGYSDMAIGLSRMLGIRLPENFNYPYFATSLQDFWQRWHISLSSWIRDYVYIPLGGNRLGFSRKLANGLIAFALCGLWHGPAWNFILWGLWHGAGLAINASYSRMPGPLGPGLARLFARVPLLGWALTLLFVSFGWLLFFYEPARAWSMAIKLLTLR